MEDSTFILLKISTGTESKISIGKMSLYGRVGAGERAVKL